MPFGPGLIIASAFFGLVHVLNTVDYFLGVYRFAWQAGLTTLATFFYGFLRERTGNVLAPAIVHFFIDLTVRLPVLMAGRIGVG